METTTEDKKSRLLAIVEQLDYSQLDAALDAMSQLITPPATSPGYIVEELVYNAYKGSGKCWIARVDPETLKIQDFLMAESIQRRDGYSGTKIFKVPLVENTVYKYVESGSKTVDSKNYYIIRNDELFDYNK